MDEQGSSLTKNKNVWYAVQTFYCKEEHLGKLFAERGLNYFIPRQYSEQITLDGNTHRVLKPAVHNLLFLEKTLDEKEILEKIKNIPIPFYLVRHHDTKKCYEIPDREMLEFRAICDPNYTGTLYVDVAAAESRSGQKVRVIRGPFTGLEGKLTQYKKRYYVTIIVATLGVMLHIPKWYCQKIE